MGIIHESLVQTLRELQSNKMIILIDNDASCFAPDNNEKFFVKSRIGHTLFCLYNLKNVRNYYTENWDSDVADLKYIKAIKSVPERIIRLQTIREDSLLRDAIKIEELDEKTGGLFSLIVRSLDRFTLSQFQYRSFKDIFLGLANTARRNPEGLTVVAETGAGKSFAYQLPLILWTIAKKIQAYSRMKPSGRHPRTNCSALLLFPRNVLAYDQMAGIRDSLIQPINAIIEEHTPIDKAQRDFLKIKIGQDFGGKKTYEQRREMFESTRPDIIVTHVESLKKRLYDPISASYYKEGIDFVLYDEVHLYEGSYGGYIRGLNARLINMITTQMKMQNVRPPFFVGMSATIDVPEKHCQKLFALHEKPKVVDDKNDTKQKRTIEHHIIIKPRTGRPPMGVMIDSISCLIHNRRDSLGRDHEHQEIDDRYRKKSITFIDSLDGTSRLTYDLNDFEWFDFPNTQPVQKIRRRYPMFYKPRQNAGEESGICDDCRSGWFVPDCSYYKKGMCWYFSNDTAKYWHRPNTDIEYPSDSIRSKRVTSQETSNVGTESDIYKHFIQTHVNVEGRQFRIGGQNGERVDNLVATNTLEVGVDYKGISEIMLYGGSASPASYKQRAGRGAREGNLEDGLVVMSVIQNTPLANFYFKHFERMVNPEMTPIKLEIQNPNIIKTQCFSSIFDYFAKQQIYLYKIWESDDTEEAERRIETQYGKALKILEEKNDLVSYLRSFLQIVDLPNRQIIDEAIKEAHSILSKMIRKIPLHSGEKALISCVFWAVKGNISMRSQMKSIFEDGYSRCSESEEGINRAKRQLYSKLDGFKEIVDGLDASDELCEIADKMKEAVS